jgi:FlaA1/EpsC-like NDP-sugar epimerase
MPPLHSIATGRQDSLLAEDMALMRDKLQAAIAGKRILAIGAAGSIGSSTVVELANFVPAALHVVDQNENALAELVRQLRSSPQPFPVADFRTLPIDYGSAACRLFLRSQPAYDLVLNFAALKHVRSEKDPFSTLQMFETNLLKQARLMGWLAEAGFAGRIFSVSTDKAANPSSMMGATKRVMEHVLFNSGVARSLPGPKSSARFANVAFSNGSLLQGFENRFARGEPLAAPRDTRRYFVSMAEAGQLCTIASVVAPAGTIVIPKLDPEQHLVRLEDIATRFLQRQGFEPALYDDERAACSNIAAERSRGRWPLLLTALDTAGEKPYEEFIAHGEEDFEFGLPNLKAVRYRAADAAMIDTVLDAVSRHVKAGLGGRPLDKEALKDIIALVEPAFLGTHRESASNLDQRL